MVSDACSLPFNVNATSSSLVLTWNRPASASSNTYAIQVSSPGTNPMSFTYTNSGSSLTYTVGSLKSFTSYTITITNGRNQCTTTASTSEGGKRMLLFYKSAETGKYLTKRGGALNNPCLP